MINLTAPTTDSSSNSARIVRLRLSSGQRIEVWVTWGARVQSPAPGGPLVLLIVFARVLCREPNSLLAEQLTTATNSNSRRHNNIIDCAHRDGRFVRLLVNCLRHCLDEEGRPVNKFVPPEQFDEWRPLVAEAKYWRLSTVEQLIREANNAHGTGLPNTIVIAYHGTLALGRGTFSSDVNFRKIDRILVSGKARACREVFGRYLNETRDWNMDSARYTSRFYLIHTFLEKAFDELAAHRYVLVSSSRTTPRFVAKQQKTSGGGISTNSMASAATTNSLLLPDERCFSHYTQYVFVRSS